MLRHPSRLELLGYAEGLVDGRGISAAIARHIAGCKLCAGEVAAIRSSIEFTASANALEPSEELTTNILVAARGVRQAPRRARGRTVLVTFKSLMFAASVALCAAGYFRLVLGDAPGSSERGVAPGTQERLVAALPSPDDVHKAIEEIQTLAAAVGSRTGAPQSLREWQQARAVLALNADLSAARAALERNPGCERATRVISTNIQRQAQALKSLYVERSL
jgi:hypothetical protein